MAVDSLPSLSEARDIDPFPLYDELRRRGTVVRDEGMGAWLVLDHAGCTFVERREDLFEEPTSGLPGAAAITGRRDLRALVGEEHDGLYRSISHAWRPGPIAPYSTSVIRPILADRLAALSVAGRMEVYEDLATRVPIRNIARILGLPDEE